MQKLALTVAVAFAVALAIVGLSLTAMIVLAFSSANTFGSNK